MANIWHVLFVIAGSAFIVVAIGWWVSSQQSSPDLLLKNTTLDKGPLSPKELAVNDPGIANSMDPIATFTTNKGTFKVELYTQLMPITTGNFIKLADSGFYNNTKFHRVIDGFMIQGGDPNTKTEDTSSYGRGGPGYTIKDEFVSNPLLSNVRGTIAMANTGQPNSGGSQFFINTVDNTGLDFDKQPETSKHPVFGRVVEGMDVVDAIAKVQVNKDNLPLDPVIIESVTIATSTSTTPAQSGTTTPATTPNGTTTTDTTGTTSAQ